MDAGHLPAPSLQITLDPGSLLLVEDKYQNSVFAILMILLQQLPQSLLPRPVLQNLMNKKIFMKKIVKLKNIFLKKLGPKN